LAGVGLTRRGTRAHNRRDHHRDVLAEKVDLVGVGLGLDFFLYSSPICMTLGICPYLLGSGGRVKSMRFTTYWRS